MLRQTFQDRRYAGNRQNGGNEWSWNRGEQFMEAQNKDFTQSSWSSNKGDGGTSKERSDSKTSRGNSWNSQSWSSNEGSDMGWSSEPQGNNKGSDYPDEGGSSGGNLETLLRGVPGMDFPDYLTVPNTDFDCSRMPTRGYYGDVDAGCQVFHICQPGNRKDSFLCPIGTIFNQKYFVCDWWYNVNCSDTPSYYDLNAEVYKEVSMTTEGISSTTEKSLPWNPQDLDKKRPTKSWGNQGSTGKQNTRKQDTPTRRGKSDSGSSREVVSSTWSQSDIQKEVTHSWSTSSGSTSGNYGSPSLSSNAVVPTVKPIWYGIDGQPAKDQSNGMKKRNGLVHSSAPFGTRMKSTPMATAGTWTPAEVHQPTPSPIRNNGFQPTPATRAWLKVDDIPETSIVPTGVKGVWEQETTRRSEQGSHTRTTSTNRKLSVASQENRVVNKKQQSLDSSKFWGQRQKFHASHVTN
ncbi:uncharacterized protein LOC129224794 [Uloborus diversus]|uniref:uncharacterized protein LOC129224794 n=1 Tax=Uloborus diversus TaxID=327109 RepID=UPI0024091C31|nr:uncharacterized protein LOC129224794 [Uloborus diversus]